MDHAQDYQQYYLCVIESAAIIIIRHLGENIYEISMPLIIDSKRQHLICYMWLDLPLEKIHKKFHICHKHDVCQWNLAAGRITMTEDSSCVSNTDIIASTDLGRMKMEIG